MIDVNKRVTVEELFQHPFVTSDTDALTKQMAASQQNLNNLNQS